MTTGKKTKSAIASQRRKGTKKSANEDTVRWLTVVGARQNNLRNLTVQIPLGRFVTVTGVSGSGKSSLVNDIISEALARDLNGAVKVHPGLYDRIDGLEHLDKVININQAPIGRTPRSNPVTYIKVFDEIRALYAKLPDSKVRGYKPGRFSFNVHSGKGGGGRCEACEGNGQNKMAMDFLADVWVTCPICAGRRFNRETLQVLYKGKSIADVLEMDVQQALIHFENVPRIARMLRTLHDVGLDYLKLGQSSTTLSGGEAQRIKLARELVKKATGRTLYLLDEPTTGLHFDDIKKLLAVLHRFVDAGNSVIVVEHNLDVIKTADWLIDLGPEGGAAGGRIVATGTPEHVTRSKRSYTGAALRGVLLTPTSKNGKVKKTKPSRDREGAGKSQRRAAQRGKNVLTVVGARQHNLKDITVDVPRSRMTVCCGPSGSGKSSFAIDTLYAEGQRRYVESLSAYARQFLSRLQPPRVEHVSGLSPAICIEQKNTVRSPRSTVGTVTEIYDYLRVLWARVGQPYCPKCRTPIGTQTSDEIVEKVMDIGEGTGVWLLAPVVSDGQESYAHLLERARSNGYARVRVDGTIHSLDQLLHTGEPVHIDTKRNHTVELVVDRVVVAKRYASRIADSVEQALCVGNGVMTAVVVQDATSERAGGRQPGERLPRRRTHHQGREFRFSQHHSCDRCGRSYDELTPHHFSFNTRVGWCRACEGLGVQHGASAAAIVVHPTRSIADGAIGGWEVLAPDSKLYALASALADHIGFDLNTPWIKLKEIDRMAFLYGTGDDWIAVKSKSRKVETKPRPLGSGHCGGFDAPTARDSADERQDGLRFRWRGFFPAINRATRSSWQYRKRLEELVTEVPCDACAGGRLNPEAAAVRVGGATIHEVCLWPLSRTLHWFQNMRLTLRERKIAGELLSGIVSRLRFLVEVGLEYVTLHRAAATLSGGEAQRIRLASQIGTGLTGVLYVLDEPTIGLHPRDNVRLIRALKRLRGLGNTLLLVEHDREVIDAADHVLDFGPGAGAEGGRITAAASPRRIRSKRASLTGQYLSLKKAIAVPARRRAVDSSIPRLIVHGAREHNLKEIDVAFPLGRFTCVTGVSGSGKSTLVSTILHRALAARIHRARLVPGGHDRISGVDRIDKVINVDSSPIGHSPTSNPATYTGVFDVIRELYAKLPLSKIRGYTVNRFSFNRPGGRCEACQGMGQRCIEMHFLPDVWIECEQCRGSRYVPETLEVRFRGKNIAEVLNLRVADALEHFARIPKVRRVLQTLDDVGLGYVQLGQSAPTLSGGESQRIKLAAELARPSTGKTLYILDEPTTGLHFDDLKKLLAVLHRLVDQGNTCICIEHNLDVIKTADWVIDLGPEGGESGGKIVVEGTPDEVALTDKSHTGRALKPVLRAGPVEERAELRAVTIRDDVEPFTDPYDSDETLRLPWEQDGKSWHTVSHCDSRGIAVEWDPNVLLFLVETMERSGSFAPTDWSHRTRIEIKASGAVPWFCHILTGAKDLFDMALRVPEGCLNLAHLRGQLHIKTLDQRADLPIYGQWERIRLRTLAQGWQECRFHLRDWHDVSKTAFRALLRSAAKAYFEKLQQIQADPRSAQPWKADGPAWHLSQRSISKRHEIRWKPALLMTMIGRFKSMQPDLRVDWATKTAVQLMVPSVEKPVGKIVTNIGRALRVELRAPRDSLTPTQIERLGEDAVIKPQDTYDRVVFRVRRLGQIDTKQLLSVWRCCRGGIVEGRLQSA